MELKLQADVFYILLVTLIIVMALLIISGRIKKADPLAKPSGLIVAVLTGVE